MSLSNTFCIGWQGIKIAGLDTFANLYGALPLRPSPAPPHQPGLHSCKLQTHTLQQVFWLDAGKTRRHVKRSHGRPATARSSVPGLTAAHTHNHLFASTTSGLIRYRSENAHKHTRRRTNVCMDSYFLTFLYLCGYVHLSMVP